MLRRRRGVWIRTSLYASSMGFLKVFEHSFDVVLIVAWCFSGFLITWKYRDNPKRVVKRNHMDMWSESCAIQVYETKLQHLRKDVELKHAKHGEKIPIITNTFLTSPESTLKVLAVNLFHPHSTQKFWLLIFWTWDILLYLFQMLAGMFKNYIHKLRHAG
jgi:hypothetical protein